MELLTRGNIFYNLFREGLSFQLLNVIFFNFVKSKSFKLNMVSHRLMFHDNWKILVLLYFCHDLTIHFIFIFHQKPNTARCCTFNTFYLVNYLHSLNKSVVSLVYIFTKLGLLCSAHQRFCED